MTGLDTNVLVALASSTHPSHAQAVNVFEQRLADGDEIALGLLIAAEFLHVITDPKRVTPPLEMREAIEWLDGWAARVQPKWLGPSQNTKDVWLAWMKQFQLGRKRILDTQYAALLYTNDVKTILTNNPDDFRVFRVFTLLTY
jgi:predicted nucleic acid-binding protein